MKIFLWQRKGKDTVLGDYVLISGISKDDETSLSYSFSYVKGQEYTLDMLLSRSPERKPVQDLYQNQDR